MVFCSLMGMMLCAEAHPMNTDATPVEYAQSDHGLVTAKVNVTSTHYVAEYDATVIAPSKFTYVSSVSALEPVSNLQPNRNVGFLISAVNNDQYRLLSKQKLDNKLWISNCTIKQCWQSKGSSNYTLSNKTNQSISRVKGAELV